MKLFKKHFYIIGEKPQTDWRRVLGIAAILAVFVFIYGFTFYRQISSNYVNVEGVVVVTEAANATSTVQTEGESEKLELNQIIELYLQKKVNFEKMVSELKKS